MASIKESVPYMHRNLGGCFFLTPMVGGWCKVYMEVEPVWDDLPPPNNLLRESWLEFDSIDTEDAKLYFIEKPVGWRP